MVKLLGSISLLLLGVCMVMAASVWAGEFPSPGENNSRPSSTSPLKSGAARIWQAGVGEGFRAGIQVLGVDVCAMYGMLMRAGMAKLDRCISGRIVL